MAAPTIQDGGPMTGNHLGWGWETAIPSPPIHGSSNRILTYIMKYY